MPSLTRDEAVARKDLLTVTAMTVDLDLDRGSERFGSTTRIEFSASRVDESTFADLKAVEVLRIELNGSPLDPDSVADGRLPLPALAEFNTLLVEATMTYSHDGQGLHRVTDPADGQAYVYGHLFLDAAPSVFACFDQPDLKAPYAVTVTAPFDWTVLGNGRANREAAGRWTLAPTAPLATYFVTVCAGPWSSIEAEHDGIRLGLHIRASMAEHLRRQADQLLEVTRQSFDYFHELFGIRYPWGDYDQVFVPDFNAGAMENPGCVVLREDYIQRGAATRDEILSRSNTVAHELAHMWFGDLVTMTWWDDLWLNESFAEYLAYRALAEATEFTDAWVQAGIVRKSWGYAEERTPSTHPVAGAPAPDAASALNSFDGIAYAKGAAVLRQLVAFIGEEAFAAGTRDYLRRFAGGNAALSDWLGALETASGRDLGPWSDAWLRTAGADRLALDPATGGLSRVPPAEHPADRPHTLDIAGFDDGAESWRVAATVDAEAQTVAGVRPAALVLTNASDLTWATVTLDESTLAALPAQLATVPDPQARAVLWLALMDGVATADVDPRQALRTFTSAWPTETNDAVAARVAAWMTGRVVSQFLPPPEQVAARGEVAAAAAQVLAGDQVEPSKILVAARVLARTTTDVDLLLAWSRGEQTPEGLGADDDFRWLVVARLAQLGRIGSPEIDGFASADPTLSGRLAALTARAALPDEPAKAWAWSELTANRSRSNHELNALADGFWLATDLDLVRPYAARYFADVPPMAGWVGEDALSRIAVRAYPARIVEPEVADLGAAAIAANGMTASVRRGVVDCDSVLRECLRSRAEFG